MLDHKGIIIQSHRQSPRASGRGVTSKAPERQDEEEQQPADGDDDFTDGLQEANLQRLEYTAEVLDLRQAGRERISHRLL